MKTILTLLAAGFAFSGMTVQAQAPAVAGTPAATLLQLKAVREQNIKLLEQQAATLKLLEEMEKTSQQLKMFGKRS